MLKIEDTNFFKSMKILRMKLNKRWLFGYKKNIQFCPSIFWMHSQNMSIWGKSEKFWFHNALESLLKLLPNRRWPWSEKHPVVCIAALGQSNKVPWQSSWCDCPLAAERANILIEWFSVRVSIVWVCALTTLLECSTMNDGAIISMIAAQITRRSACLVPPISHIMIERCLQRTQ
jgi:hypothetical protein